jgi:hypothetical protein
MGIVSSQQNKPCRLAHPSRTQPPPVHRGHQFPTRPPMVIANGPVGLARQLKKERRAVLVADFLNLGSLPHKILKMRSHRQGKGQGTRIPVNPAKRIVAAATAGEYTTQTLLLTELLLPFTSAQRVTNPQGHTVLVYRKSTGGRKVRSSDGV